MTTFALATTSSSVTTSAADLPQLSVVSNDSKDTVDYKAQTLAKLSMLVAERAEWEATVYRTSNEMLYGILQKCLAINAAMLGNDAVAKQHRAALNEFIAVNGYRFTGATPTITKVVKCVFGVDRRRVSAYSIVLREAIKQNVQGIALPAWIESNGGVEQIRLSKSGNAVSAKQKLEAAKSVIEAADVLAVAAGAALGMQASAEFAGQDCVLLATQQADGSFAVRAVLRNASAVNAALVAYYGQSKTVVQNDNAKREAANDDKAREEAINEAVA